MQKTIIQLQKDLDKELDRIGLYGTDLNGGMEVNVISPVGAAPSLGEEEPGALLSEDLREGRSMVMLDVTRLLNAEVAFSKKVLDPDSGRVDKMLEEVGPDDDRLAEIRREALDEGWEI